jgi:hypothetical protein
MGNTLGTCWNKGKKTKIFLPPFKKPLNPKKLFLCCVFFLFILYGQFLDFRGVSFQIKCNFFAFFFFLQILLSISFVYVFFSQPFFLGIYNLWQPYFCFLYFLVSFFLLFWFFKYVTGSIILIKFCTCSYDNSFKLCFKLWLHITASLVFICLSQGSQRAFRLRHERTAFND